MDFKKNRHIGAHQRLGGLICESKALRNHTYSYSQSSSTNNEQQYTPTSKSKHFHIERETKQGDPFGTLLFHSLQQYIRKTPTEKWNRGNHGVKLGEHDPDTNFSNLRFADHILLVSASLKHTLHTVCKYTPRKRKSSPTRHQPEKQHGCSSRHEHRGLTTRREKSSHTPLSKMQSKSSSATASMRVGNIHGPQTS